MWGGRRVGVCRWAGGRAFLAWFGEGFRQDPAIKAQLPRPADGGGGRGQGERGEENYVIAGLRDCEIAGWGAGSRGGEGWGEKGGLFLRGFARGSAKPPQ